MPTIRSSADLRNHYSEISRLCHETNQPVYLTVNSCGDSVLLCISEYTQIKAELELLEILSQGEEDVRSGKVALIQDTFTGIRASLCE